MATKLIGNFKAEKKDGNTYVTGWANKNIIDSANEIMKYDKIKLDRFTKNPIIFFNHNIDQPIGKVIERKISDKGVWVKAQISSSDTPDIKKVRDLINDGILKTFSIGFDPIHSQKNQDGVTVIDEWELQEISVVTLPCNIDSEFSLAVKSLLIGGQKGALVASFLAQLEDTVTDEQLMSLVEQSEMTQEEIGAVFAGDVTPVPQKFIDAIVTVFNLSEAQKDELQKLANEESEKVTPEPEPEPEQEAEPEQKQDDPPAPEGVTDENEPSELEKCVEELLPSLLEEGLDREAALARAIAECEAKGKCHNVTLRKEGFYTPPDVSNPVTDIAKGQLAMLGSIVSELKKIVELLSQKLVSVTPETVTNDVTQVTPSVTQGIDSNTEIEYRVTIEEMKKELKAFYQGEMK
jgi:HK97 family phage prohead protease